MTIREHKKPFNRYLNNTTTINIPSKLNILGHDGNTLGVNGAQVGILKQANKVSFGSFLKSKDGRSLEAQVVFEILGNLTNQTLEGELANQKIRRLLVATNLTKSDSSWAITVGLLDTSRGRSRLASCLGGKLLTRSLSSSGFTSGLLGTGHFDDATTTSVFFVSVKLSKSDGGAPDLITPICFKKSVSAPNRMSFSRNMCTDHSLFTLS